MNMTRMTRALALLALLSTWGVVAGAAEARDGKYTCGFQGENGMRYAQVQLDISSRRLWIEDDEAKMEGTFIFRREKKFPYDEYMLPTDNASNYFRYLRFWDNGRTTLHYCWSCGEYVCKKE